MMLHLIAGKAGSGKSTLAAELTRARGAVVLSEDEWLSALFGEEMNTIGDYVRYSARLRTAISPHIVALLRSGLTVVLDFPANTVATRAWMRGLFEAADCEHRLHLLDVPDDICLRRLRERAAKGDHPFAITEAEFAQITRHFVAPAESEGFEIVLHRDTTSDR